MENFLYTIRNAKEIKIVDIDFDLFRYSMDAAAGDLLITYDTLLGIVYYYLFCDSSKKCCDFSWKNVKTQEVLDNKEILNSGLNKNKGILKKQSSLLNNTQLKRRYPKSQMT